MPSTKAEQEVVLFSILLNCLVQQTECLEHEFRGEAKMRTNNLIATGRTALRCYTKDWPPGAAEAMDELTDYIYMTMRDAAHVPLEHTEAFRAHVKAFTDKYPTINLNLLQGSEKQTV